MNPETDLIEEDSIVFRVCDNCEETAHADFGYVPAAIVRDDIAGGYMQMFVCMSCGDVTSETPTDEELQETRRKYLKLLVEQEIIDKEEAERSMPGLDLD